MNNEHFQFDFTSNDVWTMFHSYAFDFSVWELWGPLVYGGTLVVVDYLQLLDQKRENPELMVQVRALQSFARDRGLIFVFISQIDRSYDPLKKPCPDLEDVRLPNPLDLSLFTKTCFLNNGEVQFRAVNV